MNKRLRLAVLGLVVTASAILGAVPGTAAQAAPQYFQIVNAGSRGCLDVRSEDGSFTDGARIQNYQCTGASEQKWYVVDRGDGYYWFVNKKSGKCIDGGHEWLIQWSCGDVDHHHWKWIGGSHVNQYQIQEKYAGRNVELPSGNGAQGQIYWTSAVSQPDWYGQLFEFHAV